MIPSRALRPATASLRIAPRSAIRSNALSTSRVLKADASSSTSSARSALSGTTGIALGAGAAGGFIAYGIWYLSPAGKAARQINSAAYTTKKYYDDAAKKISSNAPTTDQAINALKEYAHSYFSWIPGGSAAVDAAFKDIDDIREKHGSEVDALVKETYGRLQDIAKSGLSMDSANKLVSALNDFQHRLLSLAGGSFNEILDNHPQLREKIGKPAQDLQRMGEQMGPEVKKQVDETWDQLRDIFKGGLGAVSIYKAKNLIQDKTDQIRNSGTDAFQKALDQAKPMLEKNPKLKQLVDQNSDLLKQGNVSDIFSKISDAVKSGSSGDLEQYIKDFTKSSGLMQNFESYAKMIPGGDQILPKLSQIRQVAENHREEGESLLKETVSEIRKIVENKASKAQSILDKAGREAGR